MTRAEAGRVKAICLTLAAVLLLVAGAFPPCAGAMCCASPEGPAVHAQLPCCAEPSLASRDVPQVRPATFAGFTVSQLATVPAVVIDACPPPARVPSAQSATVIAHHPPAPLFLLNQQFLI